MEIQHSIWEGFFCIPFRLCWFDCFQKRESFKKERGCLKILTGRFTALRADMLLLVKVLDYEVILCRCNLREQVGLVGCTISILPSTVLFSKMVENGDQFR
jgi:hypothetical protein